MSRGNESNWMEQLSPEEREAIQKCSSSAFWTHSVPAVLASGAFLRLLKYRGVTINFWASAGTILGAGIVARISAIPGCVQEVVSKYPEGTLAKTIEEMKNKRQGMQGMPPSYREEHDQAEDRSGMFEPHAKPIPQIGSSTQSSGQTYDDLRRRNRDQYMESKRPAQRSPATPPVQDQPPSSSIYSPEPSSSLYSPSGSNYYDPPSPYMDSSPRISSEEESKIKRRKRVNQYGDEIED